MTTIVDTMYGPMIGDVISTDCGGVTAVRSITGEVFVKSIYDNKFYSAD